MKLDMFDLMVWGLFGILALMVGVEVLTWASRQIREHLRLRRNHKLGIEEEEVPTGNAGFRLGEHSSAARRHFSRDEEKLVIHQGWDQARPKNPPDEVGD